MMVSQAVVDVCGQEVNTAAPLTVLTSLHLRDVGGQRTTTIHYTATEVYNYTGDVNETKI